MIPVVLGLGGLIAKVAAATLLPRVIKALSALGGIPEKEIAPVAWPLSPSKPRVESPLRHESRLQTLAVASFLRTPARPIKQWYIYLKDTHGSVTGLVDLAGNRVATYEAGDYGEPIVDQGSVYNPYRWNGEQTDAESGLTYMRNRYYQAATGRFIQRDPISYAGGLNLYNFAGSDPINSSDPSGLQPSRPDDMVQFRRDFDAAADLYNGFLYAELGGRALEGVLGYIGEGYAALRGLTVAEKAVADDAAGAWRAARRGDTVHYDELNGRAGRQSGPSAFQKKYPQTEVTHARQGQKGADVTIKSNTKHPSTYPGSNWPPKANHGDFKPGNRGGYEAFKRESRIPKGGGDSKLPSNTVMMPYDPETLEPYIP